MKRLSSVLTGWPILVLALFPGPRPALGQATLIPAGSVWRYLDTGVNLGGQPWQTVDFNDGAWLSGPAELGYGDQGEGRPEATVIRYGPDANNKYITYYFRRKFVVSEPSLFGPLSLRVMRDDGVAVYLNGTEVFRDNLPSGAIDGTTLALAAIGGTDEATFIQGPTIDPAMLVAGTNIMAVEVHQSGGSSSDISFDLEFKGTNTPPTVAINSPAEGAVFFAPASVLLEAEASDLDGIAGVDFFQGLLTLGQDASPPYALTVSNLLEGSYTFSAVATDLQGASTMSAPVSITVVDTNPPVMLSASASSNQVIVTFSKRLVNPSATDTNNYAIDKGILVLAAAYGASSNRIVLTTTPLTPGETYTLTANNLVDGGGLTIANNSQTTFTFTTFTAADIGSPALPGSAAPAENGFDITGAGRDIRGTNDQFQFTYRPRDGDFDLKVRINSLSFSDAWAKAGLMARETLALNSRYASVFATPNISGSFFQFRFAQNGNSTNSGWFPATYPNQWLRLQRSGNVFNGYAGLDGSNWTRLGAITISLPPTLYVGMAVTSRATNRTAVAQFRDVTDVTGPATVVPASLPFEPLGASSRKTGLVISEIMYHPPAQGTNQALEFIELFNAQAFFEDIGGYRISGDVDYTFPPNTVLPAGGFLVVARDPAALQSYYGLTGVLGPWEGAPTNSLPGGQGTVRLRNEAGAVLLEVNYRGEPPWPMAADGAGHSLVLARPSYGENDPRAWGPSAWAGGSPGGLEPFAIDPLSDVVINEFLAGSVGDNDFIELYNHSDRTVDLSGAILSDEAGPLQYQGGQFKTAVIPKFVLPPNTLLGPRGFVSFTQAQLGFALDSSGERIYLVNPAQTRVIDVVDFEDQARGISYGRSRDGAPSFYEMPTPTPGAANSAPLQRSIVINEIMYNPITGDNDDEYIELYNRGASAVNLGGWRFTDGIDFRFPPNTMIQPGGYMVVCRNLPRLRFKYPNLNANNSVGDYDGNLSNNGERIALAMPDIFTVTNTNNVVITVTNYPVVNEVTYSDGGRWGVWSDGGGSSLELTDARSDNRLASNWADSDETAKSQWTSFEITAPTDNGQGPNGGSLNDNLQVFLLGVGECLLDDVEVRNTNNVSLIGTSGTFESGQSGWTFQGSHDLSSIENVGFNSSRSLHLRAGSRGDNGVNKVRSPNLSPIPAANSVVTLRGKARWLRGHPEVLFRLHGGTLEVTGRMPIPFNLGTPGAANSRAVANAGPAIWSVSHAPILPPAGQAVVVTARTHDADGIGSLTLRYRLDPAPAFSSVTMADNGTGGDAIAGDGLYSATIPGQNAGAIAAFYIQAIDNNGATNLFPKEVFPTSGLPRLFPNDSPSRECVVRWGEPQMLGSLASYHMWVTSGTSNRWTVRDNLNNANVDATFVYNNYRVIYNAQTRFAGSPWHRGQMTTGPSGSNRNDYDVIMPDDDRLLGATDFVVGTPGNPSGGTASDTSAQSEQTSYLIFKEIGVHYNQRRYVHMFVNGIQRSITSDRPGTFIMEDSQQPNSDVIAEWFPDDTDGKFLKIEDWFEFNDAGTAFNNNDADLERRTTVISGQSVIDIAPYRFMWRPRSLPSSESASDYTELMAVIDAVSPASDPISSTIRNVPLVDSMVNLDQWMRIFACQHTVGNWDSYGYDRGKNCYAYKPQNGRFELWSWDIDFTLGIGGHGFTTDVFGCNDPRVVAMFNTPEIRRMCLRAFQDIVNGPLQNSFLNPILDAKAEALGLNNVNFDPNQVTTIKNFVRDRRNWLLTNTATNRFTNFNYAVTTPANLTVNSNLAVISGVAPLAIKYVTATYNGKVIPVPFTGPTTAPTNWSVRLTVSSGANEIVLKAYDLADNELTHLRRTNVVNFTGSEVRPQDAVVINEINYNPSRANASYLEIYNTAANYTFDISGWRVDGLDYVFPAGTFLTSRSLLVLAKSRSAFSAAYGKTPFAEFPGQFDPAGETIALVKTGATPTEDVVVDKVRYEPTAPWLATANGQGAALQLIDPTVDNARPSAWADGSGWRFVSVTGTSQTNGTNLFIWMLQAGDVYIDDIRLVLGSEAGVGENLIQNGDFESPLDPFWQVATNLMDSHIATDIAYSGNSCLHVVSSSAGNQNRNIGQIITPPPSNTTMTLSYWYHTSLNGTNLVVRTFPGSGLNATTTIRPMGTTPTTSNSVSGTLPPYPLVWLNEVQPNNVSGPADRFGNRSPWIELHNNGASVINLEEFYLANNYSALAQWKFPVGASIQPGQFIVVWADGQPGLSSPSEWHTSFTLNPSSGSVALLRMLGPDPQVMDYLNYSGLAADQSYGDYPDGQPFDRRIFSTVTPGSTNIAPPVKIYINEWVASNVLGVNGYPDPADGNYDDWFELYNPNPQAVDLSGYYLTDNLTNKTLWRIPSGIMIPGGGYLLVWADNDLNQNGGTNVDLHAGFRLERNGEVIGLFAVVGTDILEIDAVTFGQQFNNISQGRYPDGGSSLPYMSPPTPRAPNQPGNTLPSISPIPNFTTGAGVPVSFSVDATDAESPPQILTYSLSGNVPAGAAIDATSGLFEWTPTLAQAPSTNQITVRVTDDGVPNLSATRTFTVYVAAAPYVTITRPSGSEITITFSTIPGKHYRAQYKNDLNEPMWTTLADNVLATGNALMVMDNIDSSPQRFYQIVQLD